MKRPGSGISRLASWFRGRRFRTGADARPGPAITITVEFPIVSNGVLVSIYIPRASLDAHRTLGIDGELSVGEKVSALGEWMREIEKLQGWPSKP